MKGGNQGRRVVGRLIIWASIPGAASGEGIGKLVLSSPKVQVKMRTEAPGESRIRWSCAEGISREEFRTKALW